MALALRYPHPITEDFIIALSRANPAYRIETTADGSLVVSPPAGMYAAGGEAELVRQVAVWNEAGSYGLVVSSNGGFTLPSGAIKSPGATFISRARLRAIPVEDARAFKRVAPDAVFELLSPTDDRAAAPAKIEEYLANGVGVAVLLDPKDRSVGIFRRDQLKRSIVIDPAPLPVGDEMPGFVLDSRAIFKAGDPASYLS